MDGKPGNIVQINRTWILVSVFIVLGISTYSIVKGLHKKEVAVQETHTPVNIQPPQKQADWWFDKEKGPNIKLAELVSKKPQTPQDIIKETTSSEEISYEREVIEQDYATKISLKKLENKARLDEKMMEAEAIRSPINISVQAMPFKSNQGAALGNAGRASAEIPVPGPPGQIGDRQEDINKQDEKIAFLGSAGKHGDYLENAKVGPRSPFELKAGTYIPAILMTGINSDLPGSVVSQVSENVYDTATGQYLLIPQGSKLVGGYDSRVSFGQNRALVIWEKIVFPDGSTLGLDKMQGVDLSGYAGFKDKVDAHYLKIYSNALLLSLVGAGYDILNNRQQQQTANDAKSSVAANAGQKLSDVGSKTMEKNMNVQPTITISPGYKFNVMVMKDVVLDEIR